MSNEKIPTYFDSDIGSDLSPGRSRLLFAAYIDRSPIDSEEIEYRIGPSKCGRFDVLWRKSDLNNDDSSHVADALRYVAEALAAGFIPEGATLGEIAKKRRLPPPVVRTGLRSQQGWDSPQDCFDDWNAPRARVRV